MKTVILAGGKGTRIGEETATKPKPMVEIGGKPILWHIMKIYSHYGHNDFVILLGYKGYLIKEYFANFFLHQSDVTIDLSSNRLEVHSTKSENWRVTLVDTGEDTLTAGRIKRAANHLRGAPFMLTYGDGVANIDVPALLKCHDAHDGLLTLTSVVPESRYGVLEMSSGNQVNSFREKPQTEGSWINGGFFVCEPEVLDYIPTEPECDGLMFERQPLERIAAAGKLFTYHHPDYWQCMDTLRDREKLNSEWTSGAAKWKVWP